MPIQLYSRPAAWLVPMNLSLPEILPVSTRPRLLEGAFAVLDLRLHLLMKSHVGRHPRALGHQHLPCRIHEASCSATKERPMSISCMPHAHVPYLAESAQAPSFHQGHVPGASCAPIWNIGSCEGSSCAALCSPGPQVLSKLSNSGLRSSP